MAEGPPSSALRIGINALYLIPGGVGGTEMYLRSVLDGLAKADSQNRYFVFRARETTSDLVPAAPNFVDCPQPIAASFRPARILYEQLALPLLARHYHLDLLFNAGFTAPLLASCPMVTVFHDLQYKRHPEYFRWYDLPFWRLLLPASAARSKHIVCLSEAVKSDLLRYYGLPSERVTVIPHAVEPEFSRIATRRAIAPENSKLILTVSTLHPHKNFDTLLRSFQKFSEIHPGWKLRIVGLKGFEAGSIEALRHDLGLHDSVEITGWIPRANLFASFAEAHAFVYPSRFEGFGIPVLEALTAGVPVACSALPSLQEIAGDCARYFDPDSPNDLLQALIDITSNEALREKLCAAGLARAARFNSLESAHKLVRVFEATAQPHNRSKNVQDSRAARSQR